MEHTQIEQHTSNVALGVCRVRCICFGGVLGGVLYSGEHAVDAFHPLTSEGEIIAEVAITPASPLNGVAIGDATVPIGTTGTQTVTITVGEAGSEIIDLFGTPVQQECQIDQ